MLLDAKTIGFGNGPTTNKNRQESLLPVACYCVVILSMDPSQGRQPMDHHPMGHRRSRRNRGSP